jgi:hypothetical protein
LRAEKEKVENGGGGGVNGGLNEDVKKLAFHGVGKVRR